LVSTRFVVDFELKRHDPKYRGDSALLLGPPFNPGRV
jgi:hypothetical protein